MVGAKLSGMVRRLMGHWYRADDSVRAQGMSWYHNAHMTCREIAWRSGRQGRQRVTMAQVCGVVAALSPRLQWKPNVRAARVVLEGGTPRGVFSSSLAKAQRIAAGEAPLDVLSGPKVRAFYAALMGDESAAVVDVWVLRAVGWTRSVTPKVYAAIARALRMAAERVGVSVARLQAVAWVAVRGRAA